MAGGEQTSAVDGGATAPKGNGGDSSPLAIGIMIPRWTSLRIPAGGLSIGIGPDGEAAVGPVIVEVTLDMWPHWLEIAIRHWRSAQRAHERLLRARDAQDQEKVHRALNKEFQHSMQAVSAAAFALDALFGALTEQWPPTTAQRDKWTQSQTSRAGRFMEVAKDNARLANHQSKVLSAGVSSVFKFRNWAVHPPRDFRQPVQHPDLGASADWRFTAYSAENTGRAVSVCVETLMIIFDHVRPSDPKRVEWAASQRTILDTLLTDRKVTVTRVNTTP